MWSLQHKRTILYGLWYTWQWYKSFYFYLYLKRLSCLKNPKRVVYFQNILDWITCTTQMECSEVCVTAYMDRYGEFCTEVSAKRYY